VLAFSSADVLGEQEIMGMTRDVYFNGLLGKLTFYVKDSRGILVSNATVTVFYKLGGSDSAGNDFNGVTDANGMFTVEGKCTRQAICSFSKEGHYFTSHTHFFFRESVKSDSKDGRWQPWNPTIEITLKEKRNPIPMYAKTAKVSLPKRNEPFGFDFKAGDLVKPHGKGEQADLFFRCNIEERGHFFDFKTELFVTAVQPEEGIIVNPTETSQFRSAYEAQESGYEPQYYLVTDRTQAKTLQTIEWNNAEYLTFRSRIVRDDEGNIISSHYGKIVSMRNYGFDEKNPNGASVTFTYYFNPTPNDRNIEYDPNENLFDKKKYRGMAP